MALGKGRFNRVFLFTPAVASDLMLSQKKCLSQNRLSGSPDLQVVHIRFTLDSLRLCFRYGKAYEIQVFPPR
jgi:hypothetical protein